MKIIRFLFFIFLVVGAFALVGSFLLLTPTGQTWVVQARLNHPEGLHGNVSSFWAFFGKLQIDDLRLERDGYVLTAPHVEAKVPVLRALVWRDLAFKTLTAKGWTLDLSHIPDPNAVNGAESPDANAGSPTPTSAENASAENQDNAASASANAAWKKAEFVFRGILDAWGFPIETSVDETELEGDVLLSGGPGNKPVQIHVKITGGGMRPGVEGRFQIVGGASMLNLQSDPLFVDVNADLRATPQDRGHWEKLSLSGNVKLKGGSFPDQLELAGSATATREKGAESYDLALSKNGRAVLSTRLMFPNGAHQISGDWKLDWQHDDSALLWADRAWPSVAAEGGGRIEIADTLRVAHVTGSVQTNTNNWEKWSPSLKDVPDVPLAVTLDLTANGSILHADRLKVALTGPKPAWSAELVGPIDIDWAAGTWTPTTAGQTDLAHLAVNQYQLSWLRGLAGDWHFARGVASGDFLVQASKDHLAIRTQTPLTATDVSLVHAYYIVEDGVDMSATISADYTADAWKIQCAPITVSRGGKTLATLTMNREKTAADKPVKLDLNWKADLTAVEKSSAGAADPMPVRSMEGNFSGRIDPTLRGDGAVNFVGVAPDQTLDVQFGISLGDKDTISLRAPVTLKWGDRKSEIVVEGNYAYTHEGHGLDATVSGSTVHLDQLEWLASHVSNLSQFDETPLSDTGLATPVWGDWFGNFTVNVNELEAGGHTFKEAGGTLTLTRDGLKLSYGRYVGADLLNIPVTGAISFQPDRKQRYSALGSIGARKIDAKPFFPPPKKDDDPVFEGKFSVETSLSAKGKDWPDLLAHVEKEYHLTSVGGLLRLLKVDVADAIPQPTSVVADSASTVGTAVGKVFGHHNMGSGEIRLPKHTQAVIDFTLDTREILYKEIDITATQGPDQDIHVSRIEMQADDEHLVGSGDLTYVPGQPLSTWPLHFDFKFGVRGDLIRSLRTAHLLSGEKDPAGYALINGDARFVGTLQKFDPTPWHDFLAAAATAKMPDEKGATAKTDSLTAPKK